MNVVSERKQVIALIGLLVHSSKAALAE